MHHDDRIAKGTHAVVIVTRSNCVWLSVTANWLGQLCIAKKRRTNFFFKDEHIPCVFECADTRLRQQFDVKRRHYCAWDVLRQKGFSYRSNDVAFTSVLGKLHQLAYKNICVRVRRVTRLRSNVVFHCLCLHVTFVAYEFSAFIVKLRLWWSTRNSTVF